MDEHDFVIERFEQQRPRLRAVAYRMLGSTSEADDALQETWLRVNRASATGIDNPDGWLTTVTARVCLNMLRSRRTRREEALEPRVPDPVVTREVVDAFFAAARGGDFTALISVLDPDVVLRADGGSKRVAASAVLRGAENVASRAVTFALPRAQLRPVRVNGEAGVVVTVNGHVVSILGFTVRDGRILAIDALADPDRLRELDLSAVD